MQTPIPVLLGADLNCYGMARAFFEAYGVRSYAFGKCELGTIKYSRIINFTKIPPLGNSRHVLDILEKFAKTAPEKPYIFGCTDEYALFIIKNKRELSKSYICLCPDEDIIDKISDKVEFYKHCASLDIPYPEYVELASPADEDVLSRLSFGYPVIIKPSSSIKYWRHPFDGMKKVYEAENRAEAERVIAEIFASGYDGKIIVQRKIDGEQYVITNFSSNGSVSASCTGRVLLGEATPKGLGNHVSILAEHVEKIEALTAKFLKSVSYGGFSNFDIMREKSTGKFYLLEINPRQGRSNHYMTAAGVNIASAAVEGKSFLPYREIFWHSVPTKIVKSFVSAADAAKISRLSRQNLSFSPLFYPYDMIDPRRAAYILLHNVGFYKKYRADES